MPRPYLPCCRLSSQPSFAQRRRGDVAFTSTSTNLSRGARSGRANVYVRQFPSPGPGPARRRVRTELVSATGSGHEGNGASSTPAFSEEGFYVAYQTRANDLRPGMPAGASQILRADVRGPRAHQINTASYDGRHLYAGQAANPETSNDDLAGLREPQPGAPLDQPRDLLAGQLHLLRDRRSPHRPGLRPRPRVRLAAPDPAGDDDGGQRLDCGLATARGGADFEQHPALRADHAHHHPGSPDHPLPAGPSLASRKRSGLRHDDDHQGRGRAARPQQRSCVASIYMRYLGPE